MKKTLLLSVVASTMIMAGGDIAPVEPVVEAPAAVSGWDFSGQAVVYYQTGDYATAPSGAVDADLFDQDGSRADFGLQLRAVNKDVVAGIGAGVEVTGLSTLNLENSIVSDVMQGVGNGDLDDMTDGGWISQMYLTYAIDNTSFKAGRQELPKSLSPFAFSEGWNVFKNTFDALLVVNTDIKDTTLVYAWVYGGNSNGLGALGSNLTDFNALNDDDGVHMLTVQNKSFEGVTLTGSWYFGSDMAVTDDINILWGDAKFGLAGLNVALQGGSVMSDAFLNDTRAFGAKIGGKIDMFDLSLSYSNVDDGDTGVFNVGGVKTPLYTQMILNQGFIASDNDTFVARAAVKALGGKIALAYDTTSDNSAANNDYQELDLVYKTKVFNDSTTLFAGYIYQDADAWAESQNNIRLWGRYNF
ncbi:hypothetical protein ACM66Z_01330 [Sulfurovum sp. ST-21]|uniref:Porin n=1 Tax=Sulfurovum indicum TaxID=2779528 RepID=A0A7M1S602_9BACT|nr:hypothetical protein [Sulfurovum indicum]QOR62149.1 hypothetical protein IMZ28_01320 [Sulfurovum indicum]